MNRYLLILFFSLSLPLFSQETQWIQHLNNQAGAQYSNIVVDNNNDYYSLVTLYYTSAPVVVGKDTFDFSQSTGGNKIILIKYNDSGNIIWAKSGYTYGSGSGSNTPSLTGIGLTTDGINIYVYGMSIASSVIGKDTLLMPGNTNSYFLIKFDSSGTSEWKRYIDVQATGYILPDAIVYRAANNDILIAISYNNILIDVLF